MVSLAESTSRDKIVEGFRQAYGILEKDYGKVVVPEVHVGKGSEPVNAEALGIAAAANASVTGYTHINPVNQPRDMHVWGSVASTIIANKRWFYVWIMFTPR
jgi:hypothetical protein